MKDPFEAGNKLSDQIYKLHKKDLIAAYKKALDGIQLQLAKMYEKFGDDVTYSDMQTYNRLSNLEKQIAEQLKILNRTQKSITRSTIKETFELNYYYTGFVLEKTAQVKLGFGLLNTSVIEEAIKNKQDRIGWAVRETKHTAKFFDDVLQEVTQGLIQGKGYVKVAREIRSRTEIAAWRVDRIVQTESHRVQTQGRLAGFSKSEAAAERLGIGIKKIWTATLDDKTRDTHGRLDGQPADENGEWHIDGKTTTGPGLFGIAEEDISCRCTLRAEIEGLESSVRKDNESKQVIPYTTFDEWKINRL